MDLVIVSRRVAQNISENLRIYLRDSARKNHRVCVEADIKNRS